MLKPIYLRYIWILHGIMLAVFALWILRDLLVPLAFAAIIAILLNPLQAWLTRKRLPRTIAIALTVLLALLVVIGMLSLILAQLSDFADKLPWLERRFNIYIHDAQEFLKQEFHISSGKQSAYIDKNMDKALSEGGAIAMSILSIVSGAALSLTLIPVYVFLILLYKPNIILFIRQVFGSNNLARMDEILREVKIVVQAYMSGLLIEAAIVSTLNTTGLLILGIPYAFLLGIAGGLLNMVPYIGGIIGISLPMLVALVTMKDGLTSAALVLVVHVVIQFFDNNLISPRIVASKVSVNALLTLLMVFAGNMLWGIGGMFLAIPITAIFKIVFDRVDGLQPWGMVLGDEVSAISHPDDLEDITPDSIETKKT